MKRNAIYIMLVLAGIIIGFIFGRYSGNTSSNTKNKKEVVVTQYKKKVVHDTVVVYQKVDAPKAIDAASLDTLNPITDTLPKDKGMDDLAQIDATDTNEVIIQEELLSQRTVAVQHPTPDTTKNVAEMLGYKSKAFSPQIQVEFWQSPLDLTGYILTRNKLKLFGFNPNESISLRLNNEGEALFLNTDKISILLHKTNQFQNLTLK